MRKVAVSIGVSVFAFFLGASTSLAFRSVSVGSAAPPLSVRDLDGKEINLTFSGSIAVVLFWRPSQRFSLEALKDLEQIQRDFSREGVKTYAVAEGATPASSSEKTLKELTLSYPVYFDHQRRNEEKYGIIVFPSTGIFGSDGRLKFYLPSRNSNYRKIIQAKLRVELGLITEKEFEQRMKEIGEELGNERLKAEEHLKGGLRLSRQGKAREAFQELRQALALDPDLVDAHLAMGYAHLELGEIESGRKEFDWVLKRHPASPAAGMGVGISEVRLGHLDEGIEILKKAVGLNPDPVQGYYELGRAYEKKGELKEALHAYKWAVRKLLQGRR